ncbi:RIP metalloprotease RseP [Ehrlichia chaffeensis str. Heartland]|uniref:Zinc metalloprotease n=2 Tax=Ehrlichia chaffeensis TaxID=945 RepID=Q2GFC8_EHRCR|nr:putative membrane-associated zinc metalloprotease [Ehrlichia chaffeensis str. Arkansas]AHX03279.1 RIP metalloprotease RseP [Ehrlichia chaffeensis str. Heartland]AHX05195.1 RIP metalloprotease RseP [Ehrlichia chaffeensis str. Jax]AHX06185.1 RIP metalloprotease RseP [Ehrlichia chaffeensis str. Liberty]AHX07965.1 RIP metalloprotease RseP [Ehrlichia chaffeensis str. Osceola]AHX08294.1 RIP metalloprotease RseP [Ehrlichia chaffeensis str. Saint Vincent]AHX09537.1 RIP metalloprotease RseP [Ehrlic
MASIIDNLYHVLNNGSFYLLSFLIIMSIIVFVHEYGHYIVAKLCNVKVEVFSIGFGPELFGINDKSGTRWKFSVIPIGGYVKMLGDEDPASVEANPNRLSEEDKLLAFCEKPLYQKFLIVFAGPFANLVFAIVVLMMFFTTKGMMKHNSVIGGVVQDSAAQHAGLASGDTILKINDYQVKWFEEIKQYIEKYAKDNQELTIEYARDGHIHVVKVKPSIKEEKGLFGSIKKSPFLGVTMSNVLSNYEFQRLSITSAFVQSINYTYLLSKSIFQVLGQMLVGKRSISELGGPIRIAQYSGESVKHNEVLLCMAMISINLGVMNLLPIPMLDGGHIFQYFVQAILRRKQLNPKYQRYISTIGLMLLLSLMIFVTFNDIKSMFK